MTTTPPANFAKRDWEQPAYERVEPFNRFTIYDGPTVGGIETTWQPDWGVLIDLPELGQTKDGLGCTIEEIRQLRDDLTTVLDQLDP